MPISTELVTPFPRATADGKGLSCGTQVTCTDWLWPFTRTPLLSQAGLCYQMSLPGLWLIILCVIGHRHKPNLEHPEGYTAHLSVWFSNSPSKCFANRTQTGHSTALHHRITRNETLRLRKHWTGSEKTHVKSSTASANTNTATIASSWRSLIICKHVEVLQENDAVVATAIPNSCMLFWALGTHHPLVRHPLGEHLVKPPALPQDGPKHQGGSHTQQAESQLQAGKGAGLGTCL